MVDNVPVEVDTTTLQAELSDLKDRFMEQADRAASSRDSIVRLRGRLRELREIIGQQRSEIGTLKRAAEDREREHAHYIKGLTDGHHGTFNAVLQRMVERSEYLGDLGAEISILEARLDRIESVGAVGVPKGTGEGR